MTHSEITIGNMIPNEGIPSVIPMFEKADSSEQPVYIYAGIINFDYSFDVDQESDEEEKRGEPFDVCLDL